MQDTWHPELFPLEIFFDRHQVQGTGTRCNHKPSIYVVTYRKKSN